MALIAILVFFLPTAALAELSQTTGQLHVIVEGQQIHRIPVKSPVSQWLLPFPEITQALNNKFELHENNSLLLYYRSQDKARFQVNLTTGETQANGKLLGYLPDIGQADIQRMMLPVNMVQVLTGTRIDIREDTRQIVLTLDERLKTIRGFQLFVNGRPVQTPIESEAHGSVLLLPLGPVVQALGQSFSRIPGKDEIEVLRTQDSTRINLNLRTGLVKVNERPTGVSPNMTFADPQRLLLPSSAIETLTGSHVNVLPGSNEIHVDLDDQLKGRLLPTQSVIDEAAKHPFTLESIDFLVGTNTVNHLETRQSWRRFNSKFRYEVSNLPLVSESWSPGSLEPDWIALEYESIFGSGGSIGDYSASRGELSGIGVSRLRGLSFYRPTDKGMWITLAGSPLAGTRILDENDTSPRYEGTAAAFRYYSNDKVWEAGLGYLQDDGDNRRLVGSQTWNWQHTTEKQQDISLYQSLDIGYFDDILAREADWRGSLNAHYRPWERLSINADIRYEGAHFKVGWNGLDDLPDFVNIPVDELSTSIGLNLRLFKRSAVGIRSFSRRLGIEKQWKAESLGHTFSFSTQPWEAGPWIGLDYNINRYRFANRDDFDSTQFTLRATQDLKYVNLTLQHDDYQQSDGFDTRISSLVADLVPIEFEFQKSSRLSLGASLQAGSSNDSRWARGSFNLNYDSGYLLGDRTRLGVNAGHLEPLANSYLNDNDPFAPARPKEEASDYLNLDLTYRISQGLQLEANYNTSFNGNDLFSIALRGHFGIDPPRRYKAPLPGRGVLKGRVFLDLNNDGIQQTDAGERGLGGIDIGLAGTPLWLQTDPSGYFTIHNLKQGSYRLAVDRKRLPLQIILRGGELPLSTVGEGQITEVTVPLVIAGQLRGRILVDSNGNGRADAEDQGLEGVELALQPGKHQTYSSAFGQYAFDALPAGEYRLEIRSEWVRKKYRWQPPEPVTLSSPEQMILKQDILLTPLQNDQSLRYSTEPQVRATP